MIKMTENSSCFEITSCGTTLYSFFLPLKIIKIQSFSSGGYGEILCSLYYILGQRCFIKFQSQ